MQSLNKRQNISLLLTFIFVIAAVAYPNLAHASTMNAPSNFLSLNKGLAGWWTFDGKDMVNGVVLDKSGQGNNGNVARIATSTFYQAGKLGQGVMFDGFDDSLQLGNASTLDFTGPFTISVWIKPSSSNGDDQIISKGVAHNSADGYQYFIHQGAFGDAGRIYFSVSDGVSTQEVESVAAFPVNTWSHLTAVYDGTYARIYKNGVLDNSTNAGSLGALLHYNAAPNVASRYYADDSSGQWFYEGMMDDLRGYNRALSATEVRQLYNLGSAKQAVTPADPLKAGLVGWWTFDGKNTNWNTNTTLDSSGSNNTGSLVGMSTTTSPVAGKLGQGLSFDGVDDYVRINSALAITSPYTVSMWLYPRAINLQQGLFRFSIGSSDGPVIYLHSNNRLNIDSASAGVFRAFSNKVFSQSDLNKWWHVVFVVNSTSDASLWKFYINGIDNGLDSSSSSGTYVSPSTTWTMGTDLNNSWPANAIIDDVRVYNKALTAVEASRLYHVGR